MMIVHDHQHRRRNGRRQRHLCKRGSDGLTITLYSGDVYGGDNGVRITNNSTLNNSASLSGGNRAGDGVGSNNTINNDGTINRQRESGRRDATSSTTRTGATFRPGATVNLGADTELTNAGDPSPGGTGTVQTTALTGNLVQKADGTFTVDFANNTADKVTDSGTAHLPAP